MTEPTTRPVPPPLEVQYPFCPLCGSQVEHDERFFCPICEASWPATGVGTTAGEWDELTGLQCPSIDGRYLPGGQWSRSGPDPTIRRCMLTAGHDCKNHAHIEPWPSERRFCWDEKGAATPQQLAAALS